MTRTHHDQFHLVREGAERLRRQLHLDNLDAAVVLDGCHGVALWIPLADAPHAAIVRAWLHKSSDAGGIVERPNVAEAAKFVDAFGADFAALIAPDYGNDLETLSELKTHKVTAFTVSDLATLLHIRANALEIRAVLRTRFRDGEDRRSGLGAPPRPRETDRDRRRADPARRVSGATHRRRSTRRLRHAHSQRRSRC